MIFSKPEPGILLLQEIPEEVAEILRKIPSWNSGSSEAAEARFFPLPAEDEEICADWKAHVQPGLYEAFQGAMDTVKADLRGMEEEQGAFTLSLPVRHIPAWINALNQARLSLASTHSFLEEELSRRPSNKLSSPRDYARLELDILAAIQEWLVEILDGED